jgi:hypothetical protein
MNLLLLLAALLLLLPPTASANEASISSSGEVNIENIRPDEELNVKFHNQSPHRVDLYWDDGQYGHQVATLEPGKLGNVNSYAGHSFFVTRHGVKEGLFADVDTDNERRLIYTVSGTSRDEQFIIPSNAAPSKDVCQDRFSICTKQALQGGCERSPGWMIVHCCKSCDPYLNSRELIDPAKRCSVDHLKTPPPVWKAGDLNAMFEGWVNNSTLDQYGFEVLSAPDCKLYNATWDKCADGGPWVVLFNNFLDDREVADLIRGGEIEGYERSTDQGAANALGEQEKIVSQTRTSSNAWCMHSCERLGGVRSATRKIEDVTG